MSFRKKTGLDKSLGFCLAIGLALPFGVLAADGDADFSWSGKCEKRLVASGVLKSGVSSLFAYGSYWGGVGGVTAVYLDEAEEAFFSAAENASGYFALPAMAEGAHVVRLEVTEGSFGKLVYSQDIDYGRVVYSESALVHVDGETPGGLMTGDVTTEFSYGTFWGGEESSLKVVLDDSEEILSKTSGAGDFKMPTEKEGLYNLKLSLKDGRLGDREYDCRLLYTGRTFFDSGKVAMDNVTPHTTITLLTTDKQAYSLAWGKIAGAEVAVLADGLEGSQSEKVLGYEVFSSKDCGLTNCFYWDYASVDVSVLPRGAYTLSHNIYDEDYGVLDCVKCSVRLVPEPCGLALALSLLFGFLRNKKFYL